MVNQSKRCNGLRGKRPDINTMTYTTVPRGFAIAKRAKEVFSTYEVMKQPQIDLNTVSFNAMLDACAKCNAYIALIACGRGKAVNVQLVILTYSTLVKGELLRWSRGPCFAHGC